MAYVAGTSSNTQFGSAIGGLIARLADKIARRRVFKRTYAELSQLSTRELEDLGISRSTITRLAYEAAYSK